MKNKWSVYEDGVQIDTGFKTMDEAVDAAFAYWRGKYWDTIEIPDENLDKFTVRQKYHKMLEEGFNFFEEGVKNNGN